MNIRAASDKDANQISKLACSLSEKYVTVELPESIAKSLLNSMSLEEIEKCMKVNVKYFVAEIGKDIVGVVGVKNNNHLHHLFVNEKFHKMGIARRLWNEIKDECITNGNSKEFTVNSSKYAKNIYEKLGFVAQSGPQERNGVTFIPMKLEILS
ncbi:MAG: GNAT family N-acetyltransferase [Sedimenticola sp.]